MQKKASDLVDFADAWIDSKYHMALERDGYAISRDFLRALDVLEKIANQEEQPEKLAREFIQEMQNDKEGPDWRERW